MKYFLVDGVVEFFIKKQKRISKKKFPKVILKKNSLNKNRIFFGKFLVRRNVGHIVRHIYADFPDILISNCLQILQKFTLK
jgi:hypothetical protein